MKRRDINCTPEFFENGKMVYVEMSLFIFYLVKVLGFGVFFDAFLYYFNKKRGVF